jgi:hypothetical protein
MRKNHKADDSDDAVWGAENIGAEVNLTAEQARRHLRLGTFGDAARKVGHRSWVGSRSRLKQFPSIKTDK